MVNKHSNARNRYCITLSILNMLLQCSAFSQLGSHLSVAVAQQDPDSAPNVFLEFTRYQMPLSLLL